MLNLRCSLLTVLSLVAGAANAAAVAKIQAADLILTGGTIYTQASIAPVAEAMAILDGKILKVGKKADIQKLAGPMTKLVDMKGRTIVPGFVESHGHFMGVGEAKMTLNLSGTTSASQIAGLVKIETQKFAKGDWINGSSWDQNDWQVKDFPVRSMLDAVVSENPVFLSRVDGHAAWVNSKALHLAGVTKASKDPKGGRIIRDEKGEPTGVLIDNAMDLVSRIIPESSTATKMRALEIAANEAARLGITRFHDAGVSADAIELIKKAYEKNLIKTRLYVMVDGNNLATLKKSLKKGPEIGLFDNRLDIRAIKLMADGAMGSRGAALISDYSDDKGRKGHMIISEKYISDVAELALNRGFQVATHAIGDQANRTVLNAYESAFRRTGKGDGARFRIEHAQLIHPDDIQRFAELGVIASMQSTHCTSDMPWVEERLGAKRAQAGAYIWKTLLDSGAVVANGSDAPVESLNPLWGFYAAITRQDHAGQPVKGWNPEQRLSRDQALASFTLSGAFAAYREAVEGSLEAGKTADFVVLSKDIMTIAPKDILSTVVESTYVNGAEIYKMPLLSQAN